MKKHIPNFITLLNLFSGCIAVVLAINNHFVTAAIFMFLGIFFDFFDGFFARKFNVQGPLGVQLDSLADMVTSGLVPGVVMFKLLHLSLGNPVIEDADAVWSSSSIFEGLHYTPLAYIGFFITLASAYRLAKFNIDEDQQSYFKGLPTPANAILIVSLPMILEFQNNDLINSTIMNPWFLVILTLISSYMLNAPVKLFALKFKTWDFKSNITRYVFILLTVVLLVVLQFAAIPLIILLYVLLSLLTAKSIKA
ncbi:phosphatidylserine synthase [Bizionia argentinensis JUB59]|uniref:Phosphatidylserine synthase n=1 Tax=Bizionia argentinensis JUB59 TaxID=1046627 RepID=G2EAU7_9FLAO|nr:CDP-alcohol phosphatidyltransferase family protein [Bizionia argentinensis]EGV44304.1 phosphatidylserine synthase [Bizionia argentinensis JUB59]